MGSLQYYRKHRPVTPPAVPGPNLTWRGVGPLNVGAPDTTVSTYTQAPAVSKSRPCSAHWDSLFTSASQVAFDLTTGEGLVMEGSIADAHTTGYMLAIRFRGGERWPTWTRTDPTRPVGVWVSQSPAPDVPMPWNTGADASSSATITAAVEASNWAFWHDRFVQMLADWLNGPCPVDATHARWNHVHYIPITGGSTFSPEMTIASSVDDSILAANVAGNGSTITGQTNVEIAIKQAWKHSLDTHVARLPVQVLVGIIGASQSSVWKTNSQFDLVDYAMTTKGYGRRVFFMRTDLRYSYFLTGAAGGFGGGTDSTTSPYAFLIYAQGKGASLVIQTAGDSSVLAGSTASTNAGKLADYVTTIENIALMAPVDQWMAIETSSSMTHPRGTTSGTIFAGGHYTIPATGGFGGGDYCAAEYFYSAAGNMQGRV